MAGDAGGRGEVRGLGLLADVEEAHDAQQHHGGGVQLQHRHLLDQRLVAVLVAGVAAPRADEDVRVGHLHVEVLGHAAPVHRLLVEVLVGAQQTHLSLQIRVLNSNKLQATPSGGSTHLTEPARYLDVDDGHGVAHQQLLHVVRGQLHEILQYGDLRSKEYNNFGFYSIE